jgi:hypothetical protein
MTVSALTGDGDVAIDPNATLALAQMGIDWANDNTQSGLTLGGGLDVNNQKIEITYDGDPNNSPFAGLHAAAAAGMDANNVNGVIFSTLARTSGTADAVGVIDDPNGTVTVAYTLQGDSNLDGTVNLSDLSLLGTNWQGSLTLSESIEQLGLTAVPEPATLALLAVGGAALCVRKRRHNKG